MNLAKIRDDRTLAHVMPLVAFMLVGGGLVMVTGSMESVFRDHEYLPWWRRYPEQWIYPLQTVIAGGLLLFWWRHYDLKWSTWKVLVGAVLGAIGIGIWLLPTQTYEWWGLTEEPEGWKKMLGILPRREGFDPSVFESPAAWWTATILRFARAVIVVAMVEELLWRGFLMRFLLNPDGDYWKVPFGTFSWRSFLIVTTLVVFIHSPADWGAALVWGTLMYSCAVWTKSLLACVVMHGVANFLMGCYALVFEKYGLW
ncbi:MAG: CAAX prenyl protease-related protein [Akkermansiaceae bacterium]